MITFQIEKFSDVYVEALPLLEAHYEEIATYKEVKALNPDVWRYLEIEEKGILRIMTARDDGVMVGYFVSMIMPSLHYKDCSTAINDILYVHPEYRGGTLAYRLFKKALQDLKENTGANLVMIHMKIKHPFRELLTKLGFAQTEENWEKVL